MMTIGHLRDMVHVLSGRIEEARVRSFFELAAMEPHDDPLYEEMRICSVAIMTEKLLGPEKTAALISAIERDVSLTD